MPKEFAHYVWRVCAMSERLRPAGAGRRGTVGGLALAAALAVLSVGSGRCAADEPPADEFAQAEVRGVLRKPEDGRGAAWAGYHIVIGKGKEAQRYRLVLGDDEARRTAEGLTGQVVVAKGDLRIKEVWSFEKRSGERFVIGEIKVKSLKKAEPPK
jgi:hypothetical protein